MTAVPPRGEHPVSAPVTSAALPDEAALKQALVTHHAMLMGEAHLALGDDAVSLASTVVEGAVVRAWDMRESIQTDDALEKFLIDDVHHAAARALRRRTAAQRGAGQVAKHTVDESWSHVLHAVRSGEHSYDTLTSAVTTGRHKAVPHIGNIVRTSERDPSLVIGLGLLTTAIVGAGIWYLAAR